MKLFPYVKFPFPVDWVFRNKHKLFVLFDFGFFFCFAKEANW